MDLENRTDEELILFAQQNGHKNEVFTKIYNRYQKRILDFSTSFCKNKTLAEDIAQETFLKVYLNLEKYSKKDDATFKTWIYTLAKNVLISHCRKKNVLKNPEDISEISQYNDFSKIRNPEEQLISKEKLGKLNQEINSLEDRYKEVWNLIIEDFKYKEIAKTLNIPIGTVKTRIHKSRKSLKENLGKEFFY